MTIELITTTQTFDARTLRRDRPVVAERLGIYLPRPYSRSMTSDAMQLTCTAYRRADDAETSSGRFEHWRVLFRGGQGRPDVEGSLLHDLASRRLLPVTEATKVAAFGCAALGLRGSSDEQPPPVTPALIDLWAAIGWPAFKDMTILRDGWDVSEDVYEDDNFREVFKSYDRDSHVAAASHLYALAGSGAERTVNALILAPWPDLSLSQSYVQFPWPENRDASPSEAAVSPPPRRLGRDPLLWTTQDHESIGQIAFSRRLSKLQEAERDPLIDANRPFDGLEGDLEAVNAAARENLEWRRRNHDWRRLLPPENQTLREQAERLVDHVNTTLLDLHISPSALEDPTEDAHPVLTARIKTLPFYDCYDLIEVTEHVGGRARKTEFLWADNPDQVPKAETIPEDHDARDLALRDKRLVTRLIGLDQSSNIFHAVNATLRGNGRFDMNLEVVPAYVDFFCSYIHAGGGAFKVVEDPTEIDWRGFYHRQRELAKKAAHPLRVWPEFTGEVDRNALNALDLKSVRWVEATMIHADGLFRSLLAIDHRGYVGMNFDRPLVKDLSARSYKWSAKTRFLLATFREVS